MSTRLESTNFETSHGSFGVLGQLHIDTQRPALVAVNDAFAPKQQLHDLARFGGASVLIVSLPGPPFSPWSKSDIPELTWGFEDILGKLVCGAPTVLFGVGAGALLALGTRAPNIVRRIVVEPFFSTGNLWPFVAEARRLLAENPQDQGLRTFLWRVFGIREMSVQDRDYRGLLSGIDQPADVLAGGAPLTPKPSVQDWPSLLAAQDREVLRRNPMVRLYEGSPEDGHSYGSAPGSGRDLRNTLIHAALRQAAAQLSAPA